jgi:putative hydrolase of the HAD superfamily
VASALLLDIGYVIIDASPHAIQAYEDSTGSKIPGVADAVADRDWDEVGRLAGLDDFVGLFRALSTVAPDTIFVPSAVALMNDARFAGLPVGVLTNHAYALLGRDWYATRPEFTSLVMFIDAAEIGCPKPDPRAYLTAADALGVAPADVVFLDDTPECVDGARAVGMNAIVVDPLDRRPAFDKARRLLGLGV